MTNSNTASAILITIPLSHYCEKARWALDRVALSYREEPHAPLLHRLATQRNEAGTVPVLVHGSSRFIDSTAILVHADAVCGGDLLYPRDAALRARLPHSRNSSTRSWVRTRGVGPTRSCCRNRSCFVRCGRAACRDMRRAFFH